MYKITWLFLFFLLTESLLSLKNGRPLSLCKYNFCSSNSPNPEVQTVGETSQVSYILKFAMYACVQVFMYSCMHVCIYVMYVM